MKNLYLSSSLPECRNVRLLSCVITVTGLDTSTEKWSSTASISPLPAATLFPRASFTCAAGPPQAPRVNTGKIGAGSGHRQ
jgi:hypothetical protein